MSPEDNQSVGLLPPSDLNPRREPVLDYPDRDYGEMTAADYAEIGFMSGLEVHQQLLTKSKLFCRCPAGRYVDHFDAEVLRHMRPTLSELGEYDGTALMEFKTRKEIVYQLERSTVCTYEIDDTPPFEIDEEAIKIALEVCRLFNLNLVSELHVMRKQYLDGSIPTGFQRTAMMGLGGTVPFRVPELGINRELRIRQLSLEEDSCREISDVGHRITFRTDRLGMPLTEVVTEPDLLTPLEVQAGGRLIARVTQATGKVRRGGGAARQDVNVSVAGGRRVEIKGVDNHRYLPRLVHIEGFRQINLLRLRAEYSRRGISAEMLTLPAGGPAWEVSPMVIDATAALRRCDYAPVRDSLDRNEMAAALRLPGFGGTLTHRTQPGVTFAGELADRARVIACLTGRPFMIHSDIEGYGLGNAEWRQLRSTLKAKSGDAIVVLWGTGRDVDTAVREVYLRALDALTGIPAETRQSFPDGTTGFERILPGADRMYPDTDTPPVPIPDAWVEEITAHLPMRPWDREKAYVARGLAQPAARRLVESPWADLFDALNPGSEAAARRVAAAFEKRLPYHRRQSGVAAAPAADRLAPWVRALESGAVRLEATEAALDRLLEEPHTAPAGILETYRARGGRGPRAGRASGRQARRCGDEVGPGPGHAPALGTRGSGRGPGPARRGPGIHPGEARTCPMTVTRATGNRCWA
jgi:glutamyl-tRNA(Gln) amidotransferase subunit E